MTNPLAQDLGGVVRLLEKATPGPWTVGQFGSVHRPKVEGSESSVGSAIVVGGSKSGMYDGYQENCEAIAAAVNLLRAHSAEIAGALEQLRDLHDSIRTVYDAVPALPITADTVGAATDALHAFCLLVGIHRVDVGDPQPHPAMQQGGGGGDHA